MKPALRKKKNDGGRGDYQYQSGVLGWLGFTFFPSLSFFERQPSLMIMKYFF
jgi:hypothetical protein